MSKRTTRGKKAPTGTRSVAKRTLAVKSKHVPASATVITAHGSIKRSVAQSLTRGIDQLRNLKLEQFEVAEAMHGTPVLPLLALNIVQTYLLEMVQAEGTQGRAMQALELCTDAIGILQQYDVQQGH
jgi:hypothetical protein